MSALKKDSSGLAKRLVVPVAIAAISFFINQGLLFYLDALIFVQIACVIGFAFVLSAGTAAFGFVFIYRVMVPITFGIVFLSLYKFGYDPDLSPDWLSRFLRVGESNFLFLNLLFDITSVLYAICTAFLLWKGLTDHDKLREALSDEANQIERFIGYLDYFDLKKKENKEFCTSILAKFKKYIENIVEGDEIKISSENSEIIRGSSGLIAKLEPQDENDQIALTEIMRSLSDLASARSRRISQMEVKMSPYLLLALVAMSFAIIYPFYTQFSEVPGENYVRQICIFWLGSLLSFLVVTLYDISQPFNGFWKIKIDAFKVIVKLIDKELERHEPVGTSHKKK